MLFCLTLSVSFFLSFFLSFDLSLSFFLFPQTDRSSHRPLSHLPLFSLSHPYRHFMPAISSPMLFTPNLPSLWSFSHHVWLIHSDDIGRLLCVFVCQNVSVLISLMPALACLEAQGTNKALFWGCQVERWVKSSLCATEDSMLTDHFQHHVELFSLNLWTSQWDSEHRNWMNCNCGSYLINAAHPFLSTNGLRVDGRWAGLPARIA